MIEERGEVTAVEGGIAWVACRAQQGCARCAAGEGCGGGLLGNWLGDRLHRVRVVHDGSARVGECVVIAVSERALFWAAALVYGVPLVLALGGAVAARWATGDDAAALAGLAAGLVVGFLWVRAFSRKIQVQRWFQPAVVRRAP